MDLQWIFKNEEHEARSHPLTLLMPSKTAAAATKTLIEGLSYLIGYFKYIERQDILDEIRVKALNDHLVEAFFGHISEKVEGNNPSCLKLCKRVETEAFHFL